MDTKTLATRGTWNRTVQKMVLVAAAIAVMLGAIIGSTGTADATTSRCGDGRCVVYLNKQETRDLGQGRAPRLPGGLPWQITVSYNALIKGHQYIARQYANRGWCSAFLLSTRPWENQGYTGYAC
ncbi:hypothetical protein CH275_11955 [Rhodococcus sp. 06-235-1A]|uniref:hypothetical protein n=1 Tax=Rhodococcus sp. 06-235-1A TaxID=2022508 RepID=UPI000B9A991B|nr:hypothetical protein [Rhodococcus sp. 06-235-1A]OZD05084.1 hypothetical protein CH275_11955 [Rhodococcus sp. 06-235-1A]